MSDEAASEPAVREPHAVVPGETPPVYRPQEDSAPEDESPRRDPAEENSGRRRRLEYPPAPEPLAVPVIDNHAHLDFRDGQVAVSVAEALDAAASVGVAGAINVGYDVDSSEFSVRAARQDPRLKAAVALHPNDAPELAAAGTYDDALARIAELAGDEEVVAVGETGLDYFRTGEEGRAAQRRSFADHLQLAVEQDLPVQIHDRDAHDDVVAVLRDAPRLPEVVVFHCFSGDAELARICTENGWYMSFAGTVTFKNAESLREGLDVADPELILVETDTPFLTPHPHRGRPNAPYLIPQTMRLMAERRGVELDALCRQIMDNTVRAYGAWL